MEHYRAGKLTDSIRAYRALLEASGSAEKKHQILCNIAVIEFELGLHRKCVRSCDEAIAMQHDGTLLTPYYLKAKALAALHKKSDAADVCQKVLATCNDFSDVLLIQLIQQFVNTLDGPVTQTPNTSTISPTMQSTSASPAASSSPSTAHVPAKSILPSSPSLPPNKSLLPALIAVQNQFVGENDEKFHPDFMAQARRSLSHATHDPLIDNIIIIAYMLVNSNQLASATKIFSVLLQYDTSIVAAWIGLGSVQALERQLQEACASFTTAISIDPTISDAWKRRGQTRSALGHYSDALSDFNQAFVLNSSDNDIYYQRGVVYHLHAQYATALRQFLQVKPSNNDAGATSKLYLMIGMCQAQLGDIIESFASYDEALRFDNENVDVYVNYGLICKEYGRYMDAEKHLLTALKLDPKRISALNILLSLYYGLAQPKRLIASCGMISFDSISSVTDQINFLAYQALALHIMGQFSRSMQLFSRILQLDKSSYRRIQRDVMLYNASHIDTPLILFNIDAEFAAEAKYAWCQKSALSDALIVTSACLWENVDHIAITTKADIASLATSDLSEQQRTLLRYSAVLSPWIQLRSPGFLPNKRQHRIFGLASIQLSQILKEHVSGEFTCTSAGASQAMTTDHHILTYRDWMDVLVKYRQVSEPDDAVWWIDRMPPQHFAEGFGLHTPMVNGELKCIRYYTYFNQGFELVKAHMKYGYYNNRNDYKRLSESQLDMLSVCSSLEDLYNIVEEDFYVITECSSFDNQQLHEGTRLTLLKKTNGFDFSIRTASTPQRWQAMHMEMTSAFDRVVAALSKHDSNDVEYTPTVLRHALEYFYYWVHFAPLSRGSAFCGYVALTAILLASGHVILSPIPAGMQMDWEAIFESRVDVFVSRMMEWIVVDKCCFDVDEVKVNECIVTLRDLYYMISVGTD